MTARLRSLLTQAAGFVLAAGLLWLALRGLEWRAFADALVGARYAWLAPLVAVLLAAHLLRAWRWTMLLDGLPAAPGTRRLGVATAFAAVMVGYMINYGAPRLGEVARTTAAARESRQPFTALLGTVVLERLLDVAALGVGLLSVPFLLGARRHVLWGMIRLPGPGVLLGAGLAVVAAAAAFYAFWAVQRRAPRAEAGWIGKRVAPLVAGFRSGLATLATSPHRLGLAATTVAIWALYGLTAWLPFALFGTAAPYAISLSDAWCIMLIGALGMVVPTPGGAGSYHYVTVQALTLLYGLSQVDAQVYAVFSHGAQLVLYTLVGAVCFVVLVRRNRSRGITAVQPQP